MVRPSDRILGGRYALIGRADDTQDIDASQSWIAIDTGEEKKVLVKTWPFDNQGSTGLQRALWDTELRTMYRVSSSPGAENSLLIIRDAGLDRKHSCYAMVLEAQGGSEGYEVLGAALRTRRNHPWLATKDIKVRRDLWIGLRKIAEGIQLLHDQSVLHRNVDAANVLFHHDIGPASFRLGGFEWSIRVGEFYINEPPKGWSVPPEFSKEGITAYRPETDWYSFGVLAVRCLLNIEAHRDRPGDERYRYILTEIENASGSYLSDMERVLLQRLIASRRPDRLTRGVDILTAISEVIDLLRDASTTSSNDPLVLIYNDRNDDFIEAVTELGFRANEDDKNQSYNPHDISHTTRLSDFVQKDFGAAQIYRVGNDFFLVGQQLTMRIVQFERIDPITYKTNRNWDMAYAVGMSTLRGREGNIIHRDLPNGVVVARRPRDLSRNSTSLSELAQSWERWLPQFDKQAELRNNLMQFRDFIRCTNQIELLMRDAELFQYKIISREDHNGSDRIEIQEIKDRSRPVMGPFRIEGGMINFLQRELDSGNDKCDLVVLSVEDSLRFPATVRIEPRDCYTIIEIDQESEIITLSRTGTNLTLAQAPDTGWLRAFGLFGQMELVRRRVDSIDNLTKHSYLLRALTAPGQVYMDTGEKELPISMPVDSIDESKQAVMKDVLRTRPIYSLQGPPGTGKTTMVAHMLRQIFNEDPVTQVLITAQAHGAVDVLRDRVREAFLGNQPLAIRLRPNRDRDRTPTERWESWEGSLEAVGVDVLQQVLGELEQKSRTPLQEQWYVYAKEMRDAIKSGQTTRTGQEFLELVKRGASITYCTTSAGDLEELARGTQSYDWTIIEEAGKCHGFDLALPMQAGHRWVLIGDQYQLHPYRKNDYDRALTDLDQVVEKLRALPNRGSGLCDLDWLDQWENFTADERAEFKKFAVDRLRTFKHIFETAAVTPKGMKTRWLTRDDSVGAIAGLLSYQYRMHPTIGTLISETYYGGELRNRTEKEDGSPADNVVLPIIAPAAIRDVGLVWLDTPWVRRDSSAGEQGPEQGKPRYTNPYEVKVIRSFLSKLRLDDTVADAERSFKVAVLSPYTQQVRELNNLANKIALPAGIEPKAALQRRVGDSSQNKPRLAHTVDSFQGNEADLVIVSLVRNNVGKDDGNSRLGFLVEKERMNVLLSRAQRLLVLVGSWEFFHEHVQPYSLDDPYRDEWHLKKVVTLLDEWFNTGKAVRIPASTLLGG